MSKKLKKVQEAIHNLIDKYQITNFICVYRINKDDEGVEIEFNCETGFMIPAARGVIDLYNHCTTEIKQEESNIILQ